MERKSRSSDGGYTQWRPTTAATASTDRHSAVAATAATTATGSLGSDWLGHVFGAKNIWVEITNRSNGNATLLLARTFDV
jgi:hypothetical protein